MWRALGHKKPNWPLDTEPRYTGAYHAELANGECRWMASEPASTSTSRPLATRTDPREQGDPEDRP